MVEIVLLGVVAVIVVGFIVWAIVSRARPSTERPSEPPWSHAEVTGSRVVLDLEVEDPDDPPVQRLVQDTATQALARDREITHVEVVDRRGRTLGTVQRRPRVGAEVDLPPELHEPHARRSRAPDVTRPSSGGAPREIPRDVDISVSDRAWSQRFELPEAVRANLRDPDHPAEVIRAVLQTAGRQVERHGELVVSDDVAFVTVSVSDGADEALTRAYLRIQKSGARHGIVVRLGYADPTLVQRRDQAAPNIRYTDVDAIQRMADALGLGADPVAFAVGPRVVGAAAGTRIMS